MNTYKASNNLYGIIFAITLLFVIFGLYYKIINTKIINYNQDKKIYTVNDVTYNEDYNKNLSIGNEFDRVNFKISVADNIESRTLGLSHTISLCEKCGKLFIFDKEGYYSFWMKDMNYDIDIIYIDKDKKIVDIFKNVKKESYPATVENATPAMYVLEIGSGLSDKLDIENGDTVEF